MPSETSILKISVDACGVRAPFSSTAVSDADEMCVSLTAKELSVMQDQMRIEIVYCTPVQTLSVQTEYFVTC